jgi:hypothetical protein
MPIGGPFCVPIDSQVEDVLAVHFVSTQRHRLGLERERLLGLEPSGLDSPGV